MIEVRLNPGVPFQGIGLKSKEINDRIKYDVLELLEKQGRSLHEQFERIITVIGRKHKMEIKFKTLTLHNFKCYRDLTVEFGDLTKRSRAKIQKSSILEAIPWLLYSVDVLGSKSDPTPINYEYDHTLVKLHFAMDGKDVLLSRGIERKSNLLHQ
ncbi:hypothetical protein P7H17_24075 [Paenibacillus larvae]|nr:hypothetical protein [Paenibacillus larvae]MDT2288510.1 hypothetical protein [Paenibacillus larvae]